MDERDSSIYHLRTDQGHQQFKQEITTAISAASELKTRGKKLEATRLIAELIIRTRGIMDRVATLQPTEGEERQIIEKTDIVLEEAMDQLRTYLWGENK